METRRMISRKRNFYISVLSALLVAVGRITVRAAQPTHPTAQSTDQTHTDASATTKKKSKKATAAESAKSTDSSTEADSSTTTNKKKSTKATDTADSKADDT